MVDFSNQDEAKRWFDGQPRDVAVVMAARAALRVLPLLGANGRPRGGGDWKRAVVLPCIRGMAASWAVAKFPTDGAELGLVAAVDTAASATSATSSSASSVSASSVSAAAASVSAYAAATAASSFVAAASSTITSQATSSAAAAANTAAGSAIATTAIDAVAATTAFAATASDAAAIELGVSAVDLAGRPLWPTGIPSGVSRAWDAMKRGLLAAGDDWDIWTDWYDARLAGKRPWRKSIEIARVSLPEDLWEQGPAVVNAEIKRLINAEKAKSAKPSQTRNDFFLSYSIRNETTVKKVATVVAGEGHRVFVQIKDNLFSPNILQKIQNNLDVPERMIAILSPEYEASDRCRAEWASFYNADPSSKKRLIVPILIAPTNLNRLAKQIVYTNIVGLSDEEAAERIRQALAPPVKRPPRAVRADLAAAASPRPIVDPAGVVDVERNAVFDQAVTSDELYGLPGRQLTLVANILETMVGKNCPTLVLRALKAVASHLGSFGVSAPLGLLNDQFAVIRAEIADDEGAPWNRGGLRKSFELLLENHELYRQHFPLDAVRDRLYREASIDPSILRDSGFQAAEDRLVRNARTAEQQGFVTKALADGVEGRRDLFKDIASVPPREEPKAPFVTAADRIAPPTLDQRLLAQESGFWDAFLQRGANIAQLGSFMKDAAELLGKIWPSGS